MSKIDPDISILIVDDSAEMRALIRFILRKIGINKVNESKDGATALAKLKTKKYDLILLDWNMPNMNGLEFLKNLRTEKSPSQNVPIIMVTAEASEENVVAAVQAGVNGYVLKPLNQAALEDKILVVLEK